jgi:hypothetical protein
VARRFASRGCEHWHGRCDFGDDHLRVFLSGCCVVVYCFTREAIISFPRSLPFAFAFGRASRVKHFQARVA